MDSRTTNFLFSKKRNASNCLPAILGGKPIFTEPMHIVRPCFPEISSIADNFNSALAKGQVTNQGPFVRAFEKSLAELLGVYVATCNSGQSALMLMLRAAGIDSGEVIVPSYTFCATPHAVKWCGAKPVFADIDRNTFCLDPKDVESRITSETRAILAVDLYGIACDYERLYSLGVQYNLKVLYDSAPAFGTKVNKSFIGGEGDAQSFSFHATKAFTTMEGGCVASSNRELIDRAIALRNFGQQEGDCYEAGINAKMQEICALIGLEHLNGLNSALQRRSEVVRKYTEYFGCHEGFRTPKVPANQQPSWLYYPILVGADLGLNRDRLVEALAAENIYVRTYFDLPCHLMSAYKQEEPIDLPVTNSVADSVISLPVYNDMTNNECERIIEAIDRIVRHSDRVSLLLAK